MLRKLPKPENFVNFVPKLPVCPNFVPNFIPSCPNIRPKIGSKICPKMSQLIPTLIQNFGRFGARIILKHVWLTDLKLELKVIQSLFFSSGDHIIQNSGK